MLIVPEIQKVFIFVPRTGSGTLYREMKRVYPQSMLLYRHAEADLVPKGYDHWEKIGFVRHPLYRLWSLYNFLKTFNGGEVTGKGKYNADAEFKRKTVERPFDDWVLHNNEPFTVPWDRTGNNDFWPVLTRSSPKPENKLSQWDYLRPDLGTKIYHFSDLPGMMEYWGLNPDYKKNESKKSLPICTEEITNHLRTYCPWELHLKCEEM